MLIAFRGDRESRVGKHVCLEELLNYPVHVWHCCLPKKGEASEKRGLGEVGREGGRDGGRRTDMGTRLSWPIETFFGMSWTSS